MRSKSNIKSIAVIIPVYKDDATLSTLLQNLHGLDITEIIIADGEARAEMPADFAAKISGPIKTKIHWFAASPKGRGSQIQAGIEQAHSDYIWVLHADSRPETRAPYAIRKILKSPQISLGTFTLKFDARHAALSLFAWISRYDSFLTTFGDQGFFFRHADYKTLKLNLEHYPLLEDVALRRAFKQRGYIKRSKISLTTSARRFEQRGIWKTQLLNAQILWRYIRGETPASLYNAYYQTPKESLKSAHHALDKLHLSS